VPPELGGGRPELRPRVDDQRGHHDPAGQVRGQGNHPEPDQAEPRTPPGDPGRDRDQEVLGEELAAGQQQRDEPDRERGRGQQRLPGLVVDHEKGQHAHADVDAADEAGSYQRDQRPVQPVAALGDEPVEGFLDVWLPGPVASPGRILFL
jgi:hypothetical protein